MVFQEDQEDLDFWSLVFQEDLDFWSVVFLFSRVIIYYEKEDQEDLFFLVSGLLGLLGLPRRPRFLVNGLPRRPRRPRFLVNGLPRRAKYVNIRESLNYEYLL
jgi:hypothetical protein